MIGRVRPINNFYYEKGAFFFVDSNYPGAIFVS
jgi:hypothetical protein